ncbi:hypothetical protein AB0C29_14500 [Actinoplanes sp. NPDC048791]|uniref:hypothetical protein n=1 Tax=Actinoplanes sp. NPDC048791 TaxID=3154623 RepID=UPI0033F8029B
MRVLIVTAGSRGDVAPFTAAPSPEAAHSVFAAFLDELGEGVLSAAAAGTDVLLTAFGPAPLSRLVAAGLGIPSAGVYLAPGVPTGEFPPPGRPAGGELTAADNVAAGERTTELARRIRAEDGSAAVISFVTRLEAQRESHS